LAYTSGALRELRLIDGDGTNDRLLVAGLSARIQGVGPVWSPAGDRIAYQRCEGGHECSGLVHDVVLVSVADGSETVIEPPTLDGRSWYPSTVSWSPDGRSLLYAGWNRVGMTERGGVIALPADRPSDAQVLMDSVHVVPWYFNHPWTAIQTWGRQPE
jgi:Tol biopolymer transport system component